MHSATPLSSVSVTTANLGFPRIGRHRELKAALEKFWTGAIDAEQLLQTAGSLRHEHWRVQRKAGIDVIPTNDFSLYDQVLDALVLIGATPERFGSGEVTLERYFATARNSSTQPVMEMTKWFDTNYHYLVPEWSEGLAFTPNTRRLLAEIAEARALGIDPRPVLLGPVTLLALGKGVNGFDPLQLVDRITTVYLSILDTLAANNVSWVQIDEPLLITDLTPTLAEAYRSIYARLSKSPVRLMLTTYFGALGDNLPLAVSLGTAGLHIDLVRAPEQLQTVLNALHPEQTLSLGCIDGRNIWLTDLSAARLQIDEAVRVLGKERVIAAPSCSLLHVPHDLREETALPPRLLRWLRFAEEKLRDLSALARNETSVLTQNQADLADRKEAESTTNATVRTALASLGEADFTRRSPYPARAGAQRKQLGLPLVPTTTIGSFPQSAEVRKHRAAWRKGIESTGQYESFLREAIADCIREQERIGLDVLVHGEFERNDMVEHFAEFLEGFAFTRNGWVQSYGSRCVKPPVIYGDVSRPQPMTVRWTEYARSLTERPIKGMLTGPITILQWSFVRDDIPRSQTTWQIALALREEILDLERAGIRIIQVDEPALREGLPLRHADWATYLDWAVKAFRLATSAVEDATQIHTHMCYCEFEDILPSIAALDADVISMEAARSKMELLQAFREQRYPNEIGPGVYDIHSPRVPSRDEMRSLLEKALEVIEPEKLWSNPDCGLKTRGWKEVSAALEAMCAATRDVRKHLAATTD
ncbi:5-methyltetrahydropteroyltriglutamate--homocysteine S-methyltransferase [Silvibacterium dinghuense]|uniref:5-methyltetrahydropteroyltriglutamate--homocysteine methyltransferase n=1 Tax=Silvibacterium dinghuense TaxID=1560006 RepID=A0A4Q1SHE4_9BACT|nr:5-methyltetrahydropteroyltriglutamate--homocysteine S-methyltransferase [Silvibacterium dinghuense]RXS96785.1 5-methyltetrahydropteroyltriglutamate--homocysteine S-methyltransferase [Silvibacterium dinghuense]GGG93631.1 5-methyltetrahydropteroyltriglutamate--homocysteine methyltransferase [Silvibacterium dinghuense]